MNRPSERRARAWRAACAVLAAVAGPAALAAQAALDRTKPPGARRRSSRCGCPPVQTATLPNGLQLAVVEMHKVPVVDVTLLVRAGAVRDPQDLPGLATFTANMLDEGAGRRSALEIAEEADFLGARLSHRRRATRTPRSACTCPSARLGAGARPDGRRRAAAGLRRLGDRPPARPAARTQILQLRDQPTAMAPLAFHAIVFGAAHPYGRPHRRHRGVDRRARPRPGRAASTRPTTAPANAQAARRRRRHAGRGAQLVEARFGALGDGRDVPAAPAAAAAAPAAAHLLPGGQAGRGAVGHPDRPRRRAALHARLLRAAGAEHHPGRLVHLAAQPEPARDARLHLRRALAVRHAPAWPGRSAPAPRCRPRRPTAR